MAMRFIEGHALSEEITGGGGPMPADRVTAISDDICSALSYAHTQGIVHRDIKPGNILLDRGSGQAVLTDFGIARASDAATMTSFAIGTPAYMSPEQCEGKEVDQRSDLYSLGIVVYEMLAGRRPFRGEQGPYEPWSTRAIFHEHLHMVPPPLRELNPNLSPELQGVIERALAKHPARRCADADTLWVAIERAARQQRTNAGAHGRSAPAPAQPHEESTLVFVPTSAPPQSGAAGMPRCVPLSRKRWLPLAVGGSTALLALGTGLGIWLASGGSRTTGMSPGGPALSGGGPSVAEAPTFTPSATPSAMPSAQAVQFLPDARPASTAMYLELSGAGINASGDVLLDVDVSGVDDLGGFQFVVTYDPTILSLQQIAEEKAFLASTGREAICVPEHVSGAARLACAATRQTPGPSGGGVIAHLRFGVIARRATRINLTQVELVHPDGSELTASASGGLVSWQ